MTPAHAGRNPDDRSRAQKDRGHAGPKGQQARGRVIDFRSQSDRPGGEFDAGRIRPEALPFQGRTLWRRRA